VQFNEYGAIREEEGHSATGHPSSTIPQMSTREHASRHLLHEMRKRPRGSASKSRS
jgi:hypothetical protein